MSETIESRIRPGYNLKDILKLIDIFNYAYSYPLFKVNIISQTYYISVLNIDSDWSKANNLNETIYNIRKVLNTYAFYIVDNGRYRTFLLRSF